MAVSYCPVCDRRTTHNWVRYDGGPRVLTCTAHVPVAARDGVEVVA